MPDLSAFVAYILMGFALAADASSVSLVFGAGLKPFKIKYALIPALAFGFAQGLMPALGWLGGELIAEFIRSVDHWIAFIILIIVGIKFIYDSRKDEEVDIQKMIHPVAVFLSAIATSIDAFAVGFTLAMTEQPIVLPASIFALVTFLCSLSCCYIGQKLGQKFGPKLLIIGGIILILIGVKILVEHLMGKA